MSKIGFGFFYPVDLASAVYILTYKIKIINFSSSGTRPSGE